MKRGGVRKTAGTPFPHPPPPPPPPRGGTNSSRTELLAPLVVGRPVLGESFLPRADVLASLAAQKKNVGGGDLKRPKGGVVLVALANMMHVLALGGPARRRTHFQNRCCRRWQVIR